MRFLQALGFVAIAASVFACAASTSDDDTTTTGNDPSGDSDLRGVKRCGGFAGLTCSAGLTCVDDPIDSCDPSNGGADCGGICVNVKTAKTCGGIAGIQCAAGLTCVDNPADGCDPDKGGADCGGICIKAACDARLALTTTCKAGTAFDTQQCKCVAQEAKITCANLRCSSGYHCEMKGINGGSVAACIKDAGDCRTNGCASGKWCSACWGTFACIPNGAMC